MQTATWIAQIKKLWSKFRTPANILLAVIIVITLLFLFSPRSKPVVKQDNLPIIQTQTITIGTYQPQVTLYGTIEADNKPTLRSVVEATVENVHKSSGDFISKGEMLIELDPSELLIRRKELQAEQANLNAQLLQEIEIYKTQLENHKSQASITKIAKRNLERQQELIQKSLTSNAELEQNKKELETAQLALNTSQQELNTHTHRKQSLNAQIDSTKARIERVDLDIRRSQIKAPFTGRVIKRFVSTGGRVQVGNPLIEIYETESLNIEAQLPSQYINLLKSSLLENKPISATAKIGEKSK